MRLLLPWVVLCLLLASVSGLADGPVPPAVSAVTPDAAPNTGTVTIADLAGSGFSEGAVVKLSKAGEVEIIATDVVVVDPNHIACFFDLTGRTVGTWDVVVTNLDGGSGTLAGGFTVQSGVPQNISLTPSGGTLGTAVNTLTSVYTDNNGASDIKRAYLLINDTLGQANASLFFYDRAVNRLYLKNDANSSWGTGYAPGTDPRSCRRLQTASMLLDYCCLLPPLIYLFKCQRLYLSEGTLQVNALVFLM